MKPVKRTCGLRAPLFWCTCPLLMLASCMSPMETLKTTGEFAEIRLRDGSEWTVELIAVQDSGMLCLEAEGGGGRSEMRRGVLLLPAASIERITVQGIRNPGWPVGVLVFQILPAIGMGIAAGSVDGDNAFPVTLTCLVPAGFSALFLAVSGVDRPEFHGPLSDAAIIELRKYARFPGVLTPVQVELLLRTYGQKQPLVPVVTQDRSPVSGSR